VGSLELDDDRRPAGADVDGCRGVTGAARGARRSRVGAARRLIVFLVAFLLAFLVAVARTRAGARLAQPDRAAEALQVDVGAAAAQHVGRPPSAADFADRLGRQIALELTVIGPHRERRARSLRHDQGDVAVVGDELQLRAARDRAFVLHVAVDAADVEVLGVDLGEEDVAVDRLGRDFAARAGDANRLVDRVGAHAPLRVLDDDLAVNRLGRDRSRAAANDDVAADGFRHDFVLHPLDADVGGLAGHAHRQP